MSSQQLLPTALGGRQSRLRVVKRCARGRGGAFGSLRLLGTASGYSEEPLGVTVPVALDASCCSSGPSGWYRAYQVSSPKAPFEWVAVRLSQWKEAAASPCEKGRLEEGNAER